MALKSKKATNHDNCNFKKWPILEFFIYINSIAILLQRPVYCFWIKSCFFKSQMALKSKKATNHDNCNFKKWPILEFFIYINSIAILFQRPVYCFWRADFHGQGATLVTPDNLMPTISP
jgi:hypothetical protein